MGLRDWISRAFSSSKALYRWHEPVGSHVAAGGDWLRRLALVLAASAALTGLLPVLFGLNNARRALAGQRRSDCSSVAVSPRPSCSCLVIMHPGRFARRAFIGSECMRRYPGWVHVRSAGRSKRSKAASLRWAKASAAAGKIRAIPRLSGQALTQSSGTYTTKAGRRSVPDACSERSRETEQVVRV